MRPGLTLRDAVLNSSFVLVLYAVYLFCKVEITIIAAAKKNPTPTTTPYPTDWGRTGATELDMVTLE